MSGNRNTFKTQTARTPHHEHFTSLKRRLARGEIGEGTDKRRRIRNLPEQSGLTWEQMAELGGAASDENRRKRK